MNATLDDTALQRLAAELDATPPRPHHSGLVATANRALPGRPFRFALTRGGWYRPGGVVRAGVRLADSVEAWAEAGLAACGGDLDALFERHRGDDLVATRISGRTHYFVAPYGAAPADFLQLEIEELHEVLDRRLFDEAGPPADLQELVDPLLPATLEAHPVAPPHYRFRRLTDMRQIVAQLAAPAGQTHPLTRFLADWALSQAGSQSPFCDHWIVAVREHRDRYRNPLVSASPVSLHARKLKSFPWDLLARGADSAAQIKAFDRAAGHGGAWYFHLVAGHLTPRAIATVLAADLDAGYHYLREQDAALLVEWMRAPYSA